MGISKRKGPMGHTIKDYWPDNTENKMYFANSYCLTVEQIIFIAQSKWPDTSLDNITIEAERIQTSCLGYDLYDPSDWTDFIVITNTDL